MRRRSIARVVPLLVAMGALLAWFGRPTPPDRAPAAGGHRVERNSAGSADSSGLLVPGVAVDPPTLIPDSHHDLARGVTLAVPRVVEEPQADPAVPAVPPQDTPAGEEEGRSLEALDRPGRDADSEAHEAAALPEAISPAPPGAPRASEGPLISPVLLRAAWVPYPAEALRRKMEGPVEVRVRVEVDGTVTDVEIVSSSPDSSLNRAALESARSMIFRPATQSGRSVSVWYNYRFDFKLPRS